MAALTQAKSLRFLKALGNTAIEAGKYEGDRIVVRRASDAILALKSHGWTRITNLGRVTIIARRDGSWPVAVRRATLDGAVSVEPPVVDHVKDLTMAVDAMTAPAALKAQVREWKAAQEAKGGSLEVTWTDPTEPRFDPEFIHAPGVCISTHDKRYVQVQHLCDAAKLMGYKVVVYEEKVKADGLTYFDVYFLPKTH